jgi:hypothetical protein
VAVAVGVCFFSVVIAVNVFSVAVVVRFFVFFFFSFSEILNFKLFIYFGFVSGSCDFVITDILFDKILLAFFHKIKLGRFCEFFVFKI